MTKRAYIGPNGDLYESGHPMRLTSPTGFIGHPVLNPMSGLFEVQRFNGATRYFRHDPNPLGAYVEVCAPPMPGLSPTGFSTNRLPTEAERPLGWDAMCDMDKHNWLVEHNLLRRR
ncbi:MAG: hypothetical protein EOM24_23460 [Chloroflexia bacterium]|nr:hypothetical protein [Chloroflexia bacterium]